MSPRTRDALLWLAGLGGAVVLLRALLDLLALLAAFVPPVLLGVLLVLVAAGVPALVAVRARLKDDRRPIHFSETRP